MKTYLNPAYLKLESMIERCEHVLAKARNMKGTLGDEGKPHRKVSCKRLIEIKKELHQMKSLEPQCLRYDPHEEDPEDWEDLDEEIEGWYDI